MSIAELGAGRGDFILRVSEAIGSAGHAFAVESAPEMLSVLREKTQASRNIHVIEAPSHAVPVATGSCDRVHMVNLWTELRDPAAALHEAARLLREDGRLILIEWRADVECPHAPASRIGFRDMVRLLEENGWDIHRHGNLGPYSYYLEAAVSDESVQS
jgi:ubiquinone/menaquinone biosynthesis C-methylase UbiE